MGAPITVFSVSCIGSWNSRSSFSSFGPRTQAAVQPAPSFSFDWKLRAWLSTSRFCATSSRVSCQIFHRVMFIRYFWDRERGSRINLSRSNKGLPSLTTVRTVIDFVMDVPDTDWPKRARLFVPRLCAPLLLLDGGHKPLLCLQAPCLTCITSEQVPPLKLTTLVK